MQFHTKTDTEVLLESYKKYGTEMFPFLDAMFAFAIYDNRNRKILLARDPFGEKPLCAPWTR